MTITDGPTPKPAPNDEVAISGCLWWWWIIAILIILAILWATWAYFGNWSTAPTVPPPTTPPVNPVPTTPPPTPQMGSFP